MAGVRLPRGGPARPAPRLFYGWIIVGAVVCLLAVAYVVWYTFTLFLVALVREFGWTRAEVAGAFSLYVLVHAGCSPITGRLVDRFGEGRIAIAGFGCAVVAFAGVLFVTTPAALFAFIVLWSASSALIRPSVFALLSAAAPADQRGAILGVNDSFNYLAFLISPFLSTTALQINPHLTGVVPCIFAATALLLGYRLFAAPRPRAVAEAPEAA